MLSKLSNYIKLDLNEKLTLSTELAVKASEWLVILSSRRKNIHKHLMVEERGDKPVNSTLVF